MSKIEDLKKQIKEVEDLKSKIVDGGKEIIKSICLDYLINHPDIKSISWQQYTPSYNDGSPCFFRYCGFDDPYNNFALKDEDIDPDEYFETPIGQKAWEDTVKLDEALLLLEDELANIFGEGEITISLDDKNTLKVEITGCRSN